MQIKTLIERPDGMYEFNAELTPEQHKFLIEFAVKTLFVQGMLPFAEAGGLIVPNMESDNSDNEKPVLQ